MLRACYIQLYDMGQYTIDHLGTGCSTRQAEELKGHEDFYNIKTDTGTPDTTHPNYRKRSVRPDCRGACNTENYVGYTE